MIALIPVAAALVAGMLMGWLLTEIYKHAAIAHSQQRMQRIVRYWQNEAIRLSAEIERITGSPLSGEPRPYLDPRGGWGD